jgi:hypothetical protein
VVKHLTSQGNNLESQGKLALRKFKLKLERQTNNKQQKLEGQSPPSANKMPTITIPPTRGGRGHNKYSMRRHRDHMGHVNTPKGEKKTHTPKGGGTRNKPGGVRTHPGKYICKGSSEEHV